MSIKKTLSKSINWPSLSLVSSVAFSGLLLSQISLAAGHHDHGHHDHGHHDHGHHDHGHHDHGHHDHGHHDHGHPSHEQKAHEHGVAQMQLTIVKHDVLIEVMSPLYNMLGFEHQPKDSAQKELVTKQLAAINTANLITINAAAKCKLEQKAVHNPFANNNENTNNQQSSHKDISFEYQFHCEKPAEISNLNADNLFKSWPNLQNLRVEWIYKNHQSAVTLTPNTPSIDLK